MEEMPPSTLLITGTPKNSPAPKSSLTAPIAVSATVKPSPIPRPSNMDGMTGFLEAKDSARPRMIQFTTISGIYSPSAAYRLGMNPSSSSSTMVTKEATITMNAGIRTRFGII